MLLPKTWLILTSGTLFMGIVLAGRGDPGATPNEAGSAAPPPSPFPATVDAKAQAVLEKSLAAYRRLQSYSDITELRIVGEGRRELSTLSVAFARPSKMKVEWRQQDETTTRRSDGASYFSFSSKSPGQYLKTAMPPASYGAQAMLQHQPAGSFFTPFLAGIHPFAAPWGRRPRSLTMVDPWEVEGVMCDLILARFEDEATGAPAEVISYQVGQKDGLLRRIVVTTGDPGHTTTTIETHKGIKANPVLPASAFALAPPVDAQPVASLSPRTWDERLRVGAPPIPISAVDTQGKPVSLAQYKGKPLLLVFWASWCPSCQRERAHIVQAYKKYHAQGLEVLGISLDTDLAQMKSYAARHEMPWRQVCDGKKWQSELVKLYGVRSIPFALLIGRDGKVAALNLSRLQFDMAIRAALRGSSASKAPAGGNGRKAGKGARKVAASSTATDECSSCSDE